MALALRSPLPLFAPLQRSAVRNPHFKYQTALIRVLQKHVRCMSPEGDEASGQGAQLTKQVVKASSHAPSWVQTDSSTLDAYAGWEHLDPNSDGDNWAGFLQIGAAVALAIGFSLVTYTAYARKGHTHGLVVSVTTQEHKLSHITAADKSDAEECLDSDYLSPSSGESQQDVVEDQDKPQLDIETASDLHQKNTASGQHSFPSEEVADVNGEDKFLSTDHVAESDLVSDKESDSMAEAEMSHNVISPASESSQPIGYRLIDAPENENNHSLASYSNMNAPFTALAAPDAVNLSLDIADWHKSPSNYTLISSKLDNQSKVIVPSTLENGETAEFIIRPEEPQLAVINSHVIPPAGDLLEKDLDSNISISALLYIPDGNVQENLGATKVNVPPIHDETASEPDNFNVSTSVDETSWSSRGSEYWHFKSVGIPAPSDPSAAAQEIMGRVVVPAYVDQEQEQALAALQALKVIESGVEPGQICTRREYARWLLAATNTLARSSSHKIFPAMYIEKVSELAFVDVLPTDPDFPYIQGLAEAGLISSNLSRSESDDTSKKSSKFAPNSPLSRLDLVCWKVALEGHNLRDFDKEKFRAKSGFVDVDKISEEAWPFLVADLSAGEQSIVGAAFGYTRRFQPDKPVTRAQAAIALATGDAADAVAEELTRIEAETMADAAVEAEYALEARALKQVDAYFNTELKLERELRLSAERALEETGGQLEKLKNDWEEEKFAILKNETLVQAEKDLLKKFNQELHEQMQALAIHMVEVIDERDKLESLRKGVEEEKHALVTVKSEVEVEKKALSLARLWAEDEANRARNHSKVLEEARKRWEGRGIPVNVDKELNDENIPALSWQYNGSKTELNKFLQRPPVQDILAGLGDVKNRVLERFMEIIRALQRLLIGLRERAVESSQGAGEKAHSLLQDTFSNATGKAHTLQEATASTVSSVSSHVSQGTKKLVADARGGAEKLVQRFKS